MTALPMDLILEAVLAGLLVLTVVYCVILDRKLRQLRSGQDGLRDIIKGLNAATERAQSSIAHLKIAGQAQSEALMGQISQAKGLTDELGLMIESGNSLADRLEGGRADAHKADDGAQGGGRVEPLWAVESSERGRPAFEDRLLKALRDVR